MSEKQFKIINELGDYHLLDGDEELCYDLCSPAMAKENWDNVVEKLNELNTEREYLIGERGKLETKNVLLRNENEELRNELTFLNKVITFFADNPMTKYSSKSELLEEMKLLEKMGLI